MLNVARGQETLAGGGSMDEDDKKIDQDLHEHAAI